MAPKPPTLPYIELPKPVKLPPRMVLLEPKADPPQYRPVILPSAGQIQQQIAEQKAAEEDRSRESTKSKAPESPPPVNLPIVSQPQETTTITLPGTDINFPVPRGEIVSTAVITAGASSVAAVAGTLVAGQVAQSLQKVLKPVMTQGLKRLAKLQGKTPAESAARQKWRQYVRTRRAGRNQV